jgi:hypothetical protein
MLFSARRRETNAPIVFKRQPRSSAKALAVDAELFDFIADDALCRVGQLRRLFTIAATIEVVWLRPLPDEGSCCPSRFFWNFRVIDSIILKSLLKGATIPVTSVRACCREALTERTSERAIAPVQLS